MYSGFAYIYDDLMVDIDYKKWADYIESVFKRNSVRPVNILDLGCGTGSFCIEMAKRGYEMTGIDISPDMLACARRKSDEQGRKILYLNQDMSDFSLYGTIDAVVCLLDSINYILDKRKLKRLFKRIMSHLNPGGILIFDVNTEFKFEKLLAGNVFYDIGEKTAYIWQNRYNRNKRICEFDLTFFIKDGVKYSRHDEIHYERAYKHDEIVEFIGLSGLNLVHSYDSLSFKPPKVESERQIYICKKNELK